jgi:hypothetical protein
MVIPPAPGAAADVLGSFPVDGVAEPVGDAVEVCLLRKKPGATNPVTPSATTTTTASPTAIQSPVWFFFGGVGDQGGGP